MFTILLQTYIAKQILLNLEKYLIKTLDILLKIVYN